MQAEGQAASSHQRLRCLFRAFSAPFRGSKTKARSAQLPADAKRDDAFARGEELGASPATHGAELPLRGGKPGGAIIAQRSERLAEGALPADVPPRQELAVNRE